MKNLKYLVKLGLLLPRIKSKQSARLANCGTLCIFVGYAENHSKDVYRMLNLESNETLNSRGTLEEDAQGLVKE